MLGIPFFNKDTEPSKKNPKEDFQDTESSHQPDFEDTQAPKYEIPELMSDEIFGNSKQVVEPEVSKDDKYSVAEPVNPVEATIENPVVSNEFPKLEEQKSQPAPIAIFDRQSPATPSVLKTKAEEIQALGETENGFMSLQATAHALTGYICGTLLTNPTIESSASGKAYTNTDLAAHILKYLNRENVTVQEDIMVTNNIYSLNGNMRMLDEIRKVYKNKGKLEEWNKIYSELEKVLEAIK